MKFIIVFFAALATSMTAAAYDAIEYRNSQLRSVFNVRAAAISVFINTTFFDPMKPGESLERTLRSGPLGGGDEIDKSLEYNGRVPRTIETLLSSKLEKSLSIRTVDWKVAPFQIAVNVRINQMLDLYGKDMFQIRFSLDLQELATARSGFNGFASVKRFEGLTFADSKGGVEGMTYAALEKALDAMQEEFSQARKYCMTTSCSPPIGTQGKQ